MEQSYYDLHVHSFLSDGVLGPGELARRAESLGVSGMIYCDHVDEVTLEPILKQLIEGIEGLRKNRKIALKVGCELTHVTPQAIPELARRARKLGAEFVAVHGETIVEPVAPGTNRAAASCSDVDLLAHPGFVQEDELQLAIDNQVALEITARRGHSLTNGYLVACGANYPVRLVICTDTHLPTDLIGPQRALEIVRAAGHQSPELVLEANKQLFMEAG